MTLDLADIISRVKPFRNLIPPLTPIVTADMTPTKPFDPSMLLKRIRLSTVLTEHIRIEAQATCALLLTVSAELDPARNLPNRAKVRDRAAPCHAH